MIEKVVAYKSFGRLYETEQQAKAAEIEKAVRAAYSGNDFHEFLRLLTGDEKFRARIAAALTMWEVGE